VGDDKRTTQPPGNARRRTDDRRRLTPPRGEDRRQVDLVNRNQPDGLRLRSL